MRRARFYIWGELAAGLCSGGIGATLAGRPSRPAASQPSRRSYPRALRRPYSAIRVASARPLHCSSVTTPRQGVNSAVSCGKSCLANSTWRILSLPHLSAVVHFMAEAITTATPADLRARRSEAAVSPNLYWLAPPWPRMPHVCSSVARAGLSVAMNRANAISVSSSTTVPPIGFAARGMSKTVTRSPCTTAIAPVDPGSIPIYRPRGLGVSVTR